jgi:hypothetical protein
MIMEYTHNKYGDLISKLGALLAERLLIHLNSHYIILVDVNQKLLQTSKLTGAAIRWEGKWSVYCTCEGTSPTDCVRTACNEAAVITTVGR